MCGSIRIRKFDLVRIILKAYVRFGKLLRFRVNQIKSDSVMKWRHDSLKSKKSVLH